jgi:hypothetical protein
MTKAEKQKIQVKTLKTSGGLLTKTGHLNDYRWAFYHGLGGTRKEATWNQKRHSHSCCGSRVAWRHKVSCKRTLDGKLKKADGYKLKIYGLKTFNL